MTLPSLPALNSTDWYAWAQGLDAAVRGGGGGGGGGGGAGDFGAVALDSFAGGSDDAKLTAALTAVAADTYKRNIQLTNRQYSFPTANRPAFHGMRIAGPAGYSNPEKGNAYMAARVALSGTGPWFHNGGATIFDVSLRNLAFTGGSAASVLGQSGVGQFYCLHMRDIFTSGLSSVLGSQATALLLTGAHFDGAWEINNSYHGAFHLGGSDNRLWTNGGLFDSDTAYLTGTGEALLWLDYCENTYVGPMYITAEGGWTAVKVSGPPAGSSGSNQATVVLNGLQMEGRNQGAPSNGALVRVDGGTVRLRDCGIHFAMTSPTSPGRTPADAGVIHHAGGQLLVDGCTYDRATGVAETVPFVYTASAGDCIVRSVFRLSRGGSWTGRPRVALKSGNTENRITDSTVTLISV